MAKASFAVREDAKKTILFRYGLRQMTITAVREAGFHDMRAGTGTDTAVWYARPGHDALCASERLLCWLKNADAMICGFKHDR